MKMEGERQSTREGRAPLCSQRLCPGGKAACTGRARCLGGRPVQWTFLAVRSLRIMHHRKKRHSTVLQNGGSILYSPTTFSFHSGGVQPEAVFPRSISYRAYPPSGFPAHGQLLTVMVSALCIQVAYERTYCVACSFSEPRWLSGRGVDVASGSQASMGLSSVVEDAGLKSRGCGTLLSHGARSLFDVFVCGGGTIGALSIRGRVGTVNSRAASSAAAARVRSMIS